ncbi:MAG: hypothetical protein ACYC2U_00065 [Candidatus Amoebophilus sp.]
MKSKYLQILLAGVILFFHSCNGCRNLPKSQSANFDVTCEVKEETIIYTGAKKRVKLSINIIPNNTVAKNMPYYQMMNWGVAGNVTGELVNAEGEKVTSDTKLQNGENILFYEPKELGEHIVTIQVIDKYQDLKKEVVFPSIIVQNKPSPFFKVLLKSASKNIFNHQSTSIELEITSDDSKAQGLPYIIKSIENGQGTLHFENGKEVKPNSKVILGSQKLIFKPTAQVGKAKIKISVSNGIGDSTASLNLEIKPLNFTVDLKGPSKHIFTYQTTPIDLTINSKEEGTSGLTYQIKTIEVLKGELQFEGTGQKVSVNHDVKFGMQHLVFKPNGETGQARVQITVVNTETKSEASGSIAWELKPLNFKANAWLREPTEEESNLIPGNLAVLEILLSGIDKNLAKEEWKIISWQFSDGVQRNIVDKELKQLSEFSLSSKSKNTLYLHLPSIRLDQEPTMTLKVEGPGKSQQEVVIQLAPIQKAIISKQEKQVLQHIQGQSKKLDDYLKVPSSGKSYVPIKQASQEAAKQIAAFKDSINGIQASSAGLRKKELEKIIQEVNELQRKKEKLDALKKESKKKKSAFKAELKADVKSLFNSQTSLIALDISAVEEEARDLIYTVKAIEVTKGTLHFENGQEVVANSVVEFGTQRLIFKPTKQAGEVRVNLIIENNKNIESTTGIVLDVNPVAFKAELTTPSKSLFNHQTTSVFLELSSTEEEAKALTYTVEKVELTNGEIFFENGKQVEAGNEIKFGIQQMLFKPTIQEGKAAINLTVNNGNGSNSFTGIVLDINTVDFKAELQPVSTKILNHQNVNLPLILSSEQVDARELIYKIEEIEVTKGTLHFNNGEELQPGSHIGFGQQNLIFKPNGETGQARIRITVNNNTGTTSSTGIVLDINPVNFKVDFQTDTKSIFTNQTVIIALDITANDDAAGSLDYTIKEIEVKNGELYFGNEDKVEPNSKVRFGWQTLVFKPTETRNTEEIKASIKLLIGNGKGSEDSVSLALSIKPIHFKIDAWVNKPAEEDKKLIDGDFGILQVELSDIDKELIEESWKLIGWNYSDGLQRELTLDSTLKQLAEFPLKSTGKNNFYLRLPSIKRDQQPTLTLKVEGPGNVIQEAAVQLAPIQKAIMNDRIGINIAATTNLNRRIDDCLSLSISSKSYDKAKELSQEAENQIIIDKELLKDDVKAVFTQQSAKIIQELELLEKNKEKLDAFKEECERRKFAFKLELETDNRSVFLYQDAVIELNISASEEEAKGLIYTVKGIELTSGVLQDQNGEEIKAGISLAFGTQKLVFKPGVEAGEVRMKIIAANNRGSESSSVLVLIVKPVDFRVDAWLREPTEEEKKLMPEDFGVIEVKISDIDKELAGEPWKIIDWKFDDITSLRQSDLSIQRIGFPHIDSIKESQIKQTIEVLLDKIRTDEEELEKLEEELKEAKQKLQDSEEALDESEERLENYRRSIESRKINISKYSKRIESAKQRVPKAREVLKGAEEWLARLKENGDEEDIVEAEKHLEEAKEALEDLESDIEHQIENLMSAEEDTEQYAREELKKKEEELEEAKEALKKAKGEKELLEVHKKKVEQQLHHSRLELENIHRSSDLTLQRLINFKETQIQQSIGVLLSEMLTREEELEEKFQEELQLAKEKINKAEGKRKLGLKRVREKENVLEKAREEFIEAKEKFNQAKGGVKEAKYELKYAKRGVKKSKRKQKAVAAYLEVRKTKEELEGSEEAFEEAKEEFEKAKEPLEVVEERVKSAKHALDVTKECLEEAEEAFEEAKEAFSRAKEAVKIAQIYESEALKGEREAIDRYNKNQDEIKIEELEREMDEAIDKATKASDDLGEAEGDFENVKQELESSITTLEETKEEFDEDEEEFNESKEKLEEAKEAFEAAEEEFKICKRKVEEAKEAFEAAEEKLEEVLGELKAAEEELDEEDIEEVEKNLEVAEEELERYITKLEAAEEEFRICGKKVEKATEALKQASEMAQSAKEELKELFQKREAKVKNYKEVLKKAKDERELFSAQKRKRKEKLQRLRVESEMERKLQDTKQIIQSPKPNLLTRELEELATLPLNSKERNKFYLKFPTIQVYQEPTLTLKVEGPGNTIKDVVIQISGIQRTIITKKMKESLAMIANLSKEIDNFRKFPVSSNNYSKIKTFIKEIEPEFRTIFEDVEASCGPKWLESPLITLPVIQNIIREMPQLERRKLKLKELKKECKKKGLFFEAELQADDRNIFNYQTKQLTLAISSIEKDAESLEYTIKEIEVKNGELCFENGSKVDYGSKLKYGKQNLTFKPTVNSGNASIHISVVNGKGSESTARLALEVLPVKFRVNAWLKDPKEDESRLIPGDFLVLEIVLSDMDSQLANGPWKLIEWNFNSDPARAAMSGLGTSIEFKDFGNVLQDLNLSLIAGGSEKKIQRAIAALKDKQDAESRWISHANQYISAIQEKFETGQKYIAHIDKELKKVTSSYQPSMALVKLHETRFKERNYREGKTKLNLEVQQLSRQLELQAKKLTRDQQLKLIQDKKINEKIERLELALEVRKKLKDAQRLAPSRLAQPILLDTELNQLTAYPLKIRESNKFYLSLPNLCLAPIMNLKIEGPGKTVQEVVVKLASVLQPIAEKKIANALETIKQFSKEIDGYLGLPVAGRNYDKLREFLRRNEPKFKETFKGIEAAYGREWWKNPMIMSLENLEYIVDEMVVLEKKKDKLDALKKACKQKKFTFTINAVLKQPEGEKLMVMDYAVLKIKLLDVDEALAGESWQLLDWQYSDNFPRGITDKDLQELTEFPLSVKSENEFYLKLPNLEIINNPTLNIQIGVAGKTIQEITLELGPIQRALAGKEMSKFLEIIQNLNREIDDYLKLTPKERLYDKLIALITEAKAKISFYSDVYKAAQSSLKSNPKAIAKILPGVAGRDLEWIIEKGIPALKANLEKVQIEEKAWDSAIDELKSRSFKFLEEKSQEQTISSIYNKDKKGSLLIHELLEQKSTVSDKTAEFIIERILDIDARDGQGYTSLHLAVKNRDLEKVKMLLKCGASQGYGAPSPDGTGSGYQPMHYVVASAKPNSYEIMLALMQNWKHTTYDYPSDEADKLLMSVIRTDTLSEYDKTIRVQKLLECGVYPDSYMEKGGYSIYFKDIKGWTPLCAALERGYVDICDLILQHIVKRGSSPHHPNILSSTGRYLNFYPYFIYSNNSYTIGNVETIRDKMYIIFNRHDFISYGSKYIKDYYEYNPFN